MSNFLEQLVNDKTANDTQWREQMQAERDNTSAMQTAGINEITSNPEAYGLYLDLQGNNPTYSAGNLALVMLLKPEATVIGTRERWKLAGRSILDSEVKNSVKIFARSPTGKGYLLADAYDVTQTAGRPIKQITLEDGSKAMEEATKRLLNFSAAPLAINKEMEMPAYYDDERMELNINPNYPNLSDADVSLIPKTIEDNGRTLTLDGVQWQEAGGFFHATATYSGKVASRYVKGYTISAHYSGEVSKVISDELAYTAVFSGTPIQNEKLWVALPVGAVVIVLAAALLYGCGKQHKKSKEIAA